MYSDFDIRMKENYERRSKTFLTRRTPVIIRVDGKSFHTFCNRFEKPYDSLLNDSLNNVMKYLCENIQGAKIAERHSDEISILLTDFDTNQTDAYFDYGVQKICSVVASMATAEFCRRLMEKNLVFDYLVKGSAPLAIDESWPTFDSRCFNIPMDEVANYFWWRMSDAKRCSINMIAQSNFSHKSLQGLSCDQMQEKLWQEKQINWSKLPQGQKIGFICKKEKKEKEIPAGPQKGEMVERNTWVIKESPSCKTELDEIINGIEFTNEEK